MKKFVSLVCETCGKESELIELHHYSSYDTQADALAKEIGWLSLHPSYGDEVVCSTKCKDVYLLETVTDRIVEQTNSLFSEPLKKEKFFTLLIKKLQEELKTINISENKK